MKLKKLFLLAAAFLMGSAAFAEIALKDAGNGQVTITFTYQDDKASEMDVIGSFDNWTAPGEAMTKNPAGLWEKAITAASTDEITYKFYSKGTWITDEKAPDLKDDGYGGHNGLIVVAD
ncbi:MAG TPA: glycogen-binding domain-containing protein, partial [Spirochaetia bacterium]|nr:glycogen-binding domain-containing protein [Spirochaetia bacterium]